MTTARGIITKAMQKAGIVTKNESPSSDEISDGLDSLNAMLGSWSNESLLIYQRQTEQFTINANDGTYTIGSGADFNTTRPTYIVSAYLTSNQIDYPLDIISDEIYANIGDKSVGGIPNWLNYNNGYTTGTIKLYPIPTTSYTLNLLSEKPFTTLALDDTVSLPPGWEQAVIYNLAVILAPEYGQPVDQSIYQIATDSKAAIKLNTLKSRSMDVRPQNTFAMFSRYTGFR